MAETIREKLVQAVISRCSELTAKPVQRALRSEPESKIPFVSVWDNGPDNVVEAGYGWLKMSASIAVEALFIPLVDESVESQEMYGNMLKAVISDDQTLDGLAISISPRSAQFNYPPDGIRAAAVSVVFDIEYRVAVGDPFTQV